MKKAVVFLVVLLLIASPAFAFLYGVQILTAEEIKKLNKDQLLDLYTQAVVEREASEIFHGRAGFSPKEYTSFKELLGLIIKLRKEMTDRGIEPPPLSEWLK